MKEETLKKIFIIFIIILVLIGIYINFFYNSEQTIATGKSKLKNIETIKSNNIRIGIIGFDNINPILSNNKHVQEISRLIFEPLFTLTQDYKVEGILAKEYSKIDERIYIVKLNEDILWHDGNKFDSSDVIFTINMLRKLESESIYYYNIKDIVEISSIDEYTLKIIINNETPYFEYNLIFPVISSKYFQEENLKSESKNIKPVGTGKFYISEVSMDTILLKRNDLRKDSKQIKLDTVTINVFDSLIKEVQAFKTDQIDLFTTSNKNIEEYLNNSLYNKKEYINRNYYYITLNCNSNILNNKEVRQAINYTIDKEEILKNVYGNRYIKSDFPLDFGSYVYDKNNDIIEKNENAAKKLLVESGWKYTNQRWRKDNYLTIDLNIIVEKSDSNMVKVANILQEQLKNIGIILDVKEVTEKQYNEYLKNRNYDMIISSSTYGYSPSLQKYFGTDNLANYYNKDIIELLKEAELGNEESEIKQKYTLINQIYNQDIPYISLYYNTNIMIYSNKLRGEIEPNSYNLFYGIESWYREYEK